MPPVLVLLVFFSFNNTFAPRASNEITNYQRQNYFFSVIIFIGEKYITGPYKFLDESYLIFGMYYMAKRNQLN